MPIEVPILEIKPRPVYQRIAPKAKQLQELGMNQSEIGRRLGVDRWTVGKALRWLAEISSTR
jgi:DNA-binding transcriptional regulator LsrR (DeoR family)